MKIKISQFEYALMEFITPEKADMYEPRTDSEELNLRQQKLLNQVKNLAIHDVSKSFYCQNIDNGYKDSICSEQCAFCKRVDDMQ